MQHAEKLEHVRQEYKWNMESLQKNLFPLMQIQIILLEAISNSNKEEIWDKLFGVITFSMMIKQSLTPGQGRAPFNKKDFEILSSQGTYSCLSRRAVNRNYLKRSTGSILGIIKVKKEDFMKGFAQASLQMKSTLTLGRNGSASSIPAIQFMQF
ncbi:hypothetical protein RhiirA4_536338 [Rhizophagus irregularis]|uniref:Uncharacterized protein n=1 Tax=Rhizophagus irregularis TaxID=588596 RepID=A0A2I1FSH9_9GLOM|nr:hypothetical protein RhiirA4_536338 [Rhizophagus irregularis]